MNNENATCAYNGEENAQLSPLQRLPVEIFLHICSFLDGSTLVHGLNLVCTRFYLILKDANSLWKARINHIWRDASWLLCPARPDKLCWMQSYVSYVAIKQETALWKQQESRKNSLLIKETPERVVAVLLMHINGISHIVYTLNHHLIHEHLPSREKSLYTRCFFAMPRHWKPIYDLTAIDNTIYSCGGDNTVNSWGLTNTDLVHQGTYYLRRSDNFHSFLWRISSCPEDNLFATGSSCGTIYVFDSRSRNNPIRHYRPHTKPVNSLAMNTEYILSATANDYTMSIWDQRAGRTMKSITFPGETARTTCINMRRDLVFVGTRTRYAYFSTLHVLNPKDDFNLVKSYPTEHTRDITGIRLTHRCLITSSTDNIVRISSLTDPPKPIATLRSGIEHINNMDYRNDTLAVSGYSGVEVWYPKLTCSTKQQ